MSSFNERQTFINSSKTLPRNPYDFSISDSWVFDNFILSDELFEKF